ncbi:TetR/AcrR family transcriptional regulator [Paenibacillus sp. J22TS3]|uniref:TetR/AcrR family transcriptional regulator n=1 Tax=Paenibacillus sp. J22TS3 TaxID=2807192 RepID=UPI001B0CCF37|nr:TetR/AcrR family transcriptional regulator [Paenibacillus sp. J22TS3]GIP24261.1 hypothetical protein J22TS3_45360 [Paenibacillus sp. J22TS3]
MKNHIAQAAAREIARRGLHFSIRDLTASLGISSKTLYQHFESKEAIIGYLVEQSIEDMRSEEQRLLGNHDMPLSKRLRELLIVLPQGFSFTQVGVLDELRRKYPAGWATLDEYLNQGWDNIRRLFQEGMESGEFRRFNPELFIQAYVGGMYQIMDSEGGRQRGVQETLAELVDLLLNGIHAPGSNDKSKEDME